MARKYPMTVDEIVTSYRQARNRQTQIGVLADLNVCTRKEIRELLAEAGVLSPPAPETAKKGGRPLSFDEELARRLWAEGMTDAEIAEKRKSWASPWSAWSGGASGWDCCVPGCRPSAGRTRAKTEDRRRPEEHRRNRL